VQYHRGVQQYRKTRRRFERCGDVRFLTFSCFQPGATASERSESAVRARVGRETSPQR
jgi:hypothetical protein